MKTLSFIELASKENFQISSIFIMKQKWSQGRVFVMDKPRKQSALLWFCGSSGKFSPKGTGDVFAATGDVVYIPEGCEYSLEFSDCKSLPSTVLIEFCLSDDEPFTLAKSITVLEKKHVDSAIAENMLRLVSLYAMPSRPWLQIKSLLLHLFSLLASGEESLRITTRGFATIEKGIRYLQIDERQELTIQEIAAMCYVTPAYFRRTFRAYAGTSPSKYRSMHKIDKAKELLTNSDLSVDEISERLGFDNPSYFCRVFKKETGVAPTVFKKSPLSIEK